MNGWVDLDEAQLERLVRDPALLRRRIAELETPSGDEAPLAQQRRVSVVVPAHAAVRTVAETIATLRSQTLPASAYEVVVVVNGPHDGTLAAVTGEAAPGFTLRVFQTGLANAAAARNVGLSAARGEYITFVDADDRVGPTYLESLLSAARPDVVAVAPIRDVSASGVPVTDVSTLAERILSLPAAGTPLHRAPWLLGFNACKLVHRRLIQDRPYDESLRSGEDVVYWAGLLRHEGLTIARADSDPHGGYVRRIVDGSVSRKPLSFDFAVGQRLDVIRRLEGLRAEVTTDGAAAVDALVSAQAGFLRRYVEARPEEADDVAEAVQSAAVPSFPWRVLETAPASRLVISYCFAPFSDTSAVVAAKVVAEERQPVDVILNDMSAVRSRDDRIGEIARRWVRRIDIVDEPPAFSDWGLISRFSDRALEIVRRNQAERGAYATMYSRALWVGSHLAAARVKIRQPRVRWSAEFSDPLRRGVDGRPRSGALADDVAASELRSALAPDVVRREGIDTLFDLVEIATFSLADEVIFTNANQLEYMVGLLRSSRLRQSVLEKAVVRPHPTPAPSMYSAVPTTYELQPGVVNLAYFGGFYENRGINDVLVGLMNLPEDVRRRVHFHVFCNRVDEVRASVAAYGLLGNVLVNGYLSYLEFLNASTQFDVLVAVDVERGGSLPVNPYLPSKVSDYLGSGSDIWAISDPGSPLSALDVRYRSRVGDSRASCTLLEQMVEDLAT